MWYRSSHILFFSINKAQCKFSHWRPILCLVTQTLTVMSAGLHWSSCVFPSAAQRSVPTPAQAAAPGPAPSLVAPPPAPPAPPQRPSATSITVELLKTRGLAGLYRGAGATLMRSTTHKDINTHTHPLT